jgi:hypothetical protein
MLPRFALVASSFHLYASSHSVQTVTNVLMVCLSYFVSILNAQAIFQRVEAIHMVISFFFFYFEH